MLSLFSRTSQCAALLSLHLLVVLLACSCVDALSIDMQRMPTVPTSNRVPGQTIDLNGGIISIGQYYVRAQVMK